MRLLAKVTKLPGRVKAYFTRRRRDSTPPSPTGQVAGTGEQSVGQTDAHPTDIAVPSRPSASGAHDATHSDMNSPQPSGVASPTEASQILTVAVPQSNDHPLVTDSQEESLLSKGFALFKSALEVTKEFAEPFPPLKYAATGLLIVMEGFEKVEEVQAEFEYVGRKLMFLQTTYDQHRSQLEASESTKASMESLAQAMGIAQKTVQAKSARRGLFQRILEYPSDVKAVADALRMLGDVVDWFIISVTVSTHSMLSRGLQDQVIKELAFAETAQFSHVQNGRLCAEGTRAEFLADLLAWATAANQPSICWVNGGAGSGKTTIAYTLCSVLQGLNLLGGSFFCSRDADTKRRSSELIFSTLARSLAHYDVAYARLLAQVLKVPGAGSIVASEQFTTLIAAPIRASQVSGSSSTTPIRILVIDALDECGDDDWMVHNLIRRMLADSRGLRLKFLITSRPESHIARAFDCAEQDSYLIRGVQDIPDDVAKIDVGTYVAAELTECARSCGINDGWPPAVQVQALASQAGTLFIYASTACKYVRNFNDDPKGRLTALTTVHTQPLRGIDPMYEFILNKARQSKSDYVWANTRQCIQTIICLTHPLSLTDMGILLDIGLYEIRTALAGLQSVIRIPSLDVTDTITVFHASFPDYVLDNDRSHGKDWLLDREAVHRDLLQRCMAIMTSSLCFNISESHTSYASNNKQPVKPVLDGALSYSCLHWIDHLEGSRDSAVPDLAELSRLLMGRFLYWLEVLSVTGEVRRAATVLTRLLNWLHAHASASAVAKSPVQLDTTASSTTPDDLVQFARDARDFVNRFTHPIEESCPHIYLSALAATTNASMIRTKMSPVFRTLPRFITRQTQNVCPIFILHGHTKVVRSVAFSPDGTRVVSGACDHTIRLWDTATGAAIGDPLRGHESWVNSVALSLDGTRVVSGSSDRTVRVWDAATGAAIGEPFRGHEKLVTSAVFSPDGTRVVSGSQDCTIRLWDAATGAAIGNPLRGHEEWVMSVAFSPDGMRVVSGSLDHTIRLWDADTGAAIGDPLRGHEGGIWSVAFSPDGTRVVSGSRDCTIRLWDAATGASIGGPLLGHEGYIESVAFALDGTRIVSGSYDYTIRLWDAATGAAIGDPLRDHAGYTNSVAFSPDGTLVVSGSNDCKIRLWNAPTRTSIGDNVRGHKRRITSVAFSPDGTRVASGSDDCTIRLWDAATGAAVGGPLRGHDDVVRSVTFSPDGTRVVSGSLDHTICLWDAATGAAIGDPLRSHEGGIWSVAFSLDGTRVVSSSSDGTIQLWDAATRAAIGNPLRGHEDEVRCVAFSPDGTRVVSGSDDCTIQLWDVATGAAISKLLRSYEGSIISIAFSPDGTRIVSGSNTRRIRLWDAALEKTTGRSLVGHQGSIPSVAFSPDGTRVVSCSIDSTIRLWDVATGAAIGEPLRGHEGWVNSVAFSPDGTRVVSSSSDRMLRLWDVSIGAAVDDPLLDHRHRIAFSPVAAHATGVDALLPPRSGRDPRDAFTLREDGWLLGPNGELFLWILPEYRLGFWRPRNTAIMGTHPVTLDLSNFAHGEDWTRCFQEPDNMRSSR